MNSKIGVSLGITKINVIRPRSKVRRGESPGEFDL
jgi:hypothetical protein